MLEWNHSTLDQSLFMRVRPKGGHDYYAVQVYEQRGNWKQASSVTYPDYVSAKNQQNKLCLYYKERGARYKTIVRMFGRVPSTGEWETLFECFRGPGWPKQALAGPGQLGDTVVVERSPGWFLVSVALWGLAGYGAYKLIKSS